LRDAGILHAFHVSPPSQSFCYRGHANLQY
jgi:hypothetical protein